MIHTVSPVPCHVRHLPGGAIELMPIVLPMTLTPAQRRDLAALLLEGLDDDAPAPGRGGYLASLAR